MHKRVLLVSSLLMFWLVSGLIVHQLDAQEPVGTPRGFIGPPEFWPPPKGVRVAYQRVNVTVENQVAVTHVDQLFVNDNDWMMEGNYLFPLPEGAAVTELTMWVAGEPIEAQDLRCR